MSATRTNPFLNRRHLFVGAGAALVAAGCSSVVGPPAAPQLYVLKPDMGPVANAPKVSWQLEIERPSSPGSLATDRIALSNSATRMDYYANAAWGDQLPSLVQNLLVEAFENSGKIAAVAPDSAALRADYMLFTNIRDFEAVYDTPDAAPQIRVHIEAKLARGRAIVATLSAAQQAQASANSVDAAVQAFNQALGSVLQQIVAWALSAPGTAAG